MKPPKPTEGIARHCWGKRRRAAKKIEKGIWKAMGRLGILARSEESSETCSWEEQVVRRSWPSRGRRIPYIARWSGPTYECDDWGESPVRYVAHTHLDQSQWDAFAARGFSGQEPEGVAKSDRHALQLLRQEIRDRKHRSQATGQRGEG